MHLPWMDKWQTIHNYLTVTATHSEHMQSITFVPSYQCFYDEAKSSHVEFFLSHFKITTQQSHEATGLNSIHKNTS